MTDADLITSLRAAIQELGDLLRDERRIAGVWASRCKAAEERAFGAEAERRAFSAHIDELEALLRTPVRAAATVPPRPIARCSACGRPAVRDPAIGECPACAGMHVPPQPAPELVQGAAWHPDPNALRRPAEWRGKDRVWEETAIDRVRQENRAAALDCNGRQIDVSDINRAFFDANRIPPCPCGACSASAPCPEPDDATTEA